MVELLAEFRDGLVQFGKRVELAMPERRDDPAFGQQNRIFDLSLVPRSIWPRRQDSNPVVNPQFGVGAVQIRFVTASAGDARTGVVRHDQLWDTAEKLECLNMTVNPVGQILAQCRLGKSV